MARQVKRISDLPEAGPIQGDELLEIVQSGVNVRVRADELGGTELPIEITDVTGLPEALDDRVLDDDPRLSDSRVPKGGAGGVLSGQYPNPGFAVPMATMEALENFDDSIRQDLADPDKGAAMVAYGGETTKDALDARAPYIKGLQQVASNHTKMLVRIAQYPTSIGTIPSRMYLVSPDAFAKGYLLYELRRGVVTSSGSVGGAGELLRITSIFKQDVAWVGRHSYYDVSDPSHWTENAYTPAGTTTKFTAVALQDVGKYWTYASGSGGAWIEFRIPFNAQGEANLQFLKTSGSASNVEIQIDGGPVEVVDLVADAPYIYRHPLKGAPGFRIVRISKPTVVGVLNIFGGNYEDISSSGRYPNPVGFVTWGGDRLYTAGEGANDYAVLDADSGLFAGSFHGGETVSHQAFYIDGVDTAVTASMMFGRDIRIVQKTTIAWPSGAELQTRSVHAFDRDGGYGFEATLQGEVTTGTAYSAMHTTPNRFTELVFPVYRDISTEPDGFKVLPKTDTVVQFDPVTGDEVTTRVSIVDDRRNIYGGPSVRKVAGSYNKLYYGPCISGENKSMNLILCSFSKGFL